jgi:hypothetical protein
LRLRHASVIAARGRSRKRTGAAIRNNEHIECKVNDDCGNLTEFA